MQLSFKNNASEEENLSNEISFKKLNKEQQDIILMYINARQFKNAILIDEMVIVPSKRNGLSENSKIIANNGQLTITARGDKFISKSFPFIVNKAFACEVYLKLILIMKNINWDDLKKNKKGHDLFALYKKTPQELKKEVLFFFQDKQKINNQELENKVKNISNAFIDWRYSYENYETKSTDFVFLDNFCDYLDKHVIELINKMYNYNVSIDIR